MHASDRIVTLRWLARDFRADAERYLSGEWAPPAGLTRERAYRAAHRLARRYDAEAANLTAAARGPIVPPSSFGPMIGGR